mmetsp:Transcript_7941/g.19192  ORF Transcript_7941/g.19192 Transcript_7941/m.19192 type:complete len:232 (+) Transcript_7941:2443-3138(+)
MKKLRCRPRRRKSKELASENKTKPKDWRRRKPSESKKKKPAKQKKSVERKKKPGARKRLRKKSVVKLKQIEWLKKENAEVVSRKIVDQDLHEHWKMLLVADTLRPLEEDRAAVILVAAALEEVATLEEVVTKAVLEATVEVAMVTEIVVAGMEIEEVDMVTETVMVVTEIEEADMETETAEVATETDVGDTETETAATMAVVADGVVRIDVGVIEKRFCRLPYDAVHCNIA